MEGYRPLTCLCPCSSTETCFSSSLLSVSKSLRSVYVLPCHGSVGQVRVWIHWDVFFSSRSLLPYYYSPPLHTHLLHLSKQIGALICLFFRSFRVIPHGRFALMGGLLSWEVCPEGVIAGVRSLPMHQQKCICASPGKSYQLGSRASLFLW